jgi:Fur family peroxide stress response transcriptional regulator
LNRLDREDLERPYFEALAVQLPPSTLFEHAVHPWANGSLVSALDKYSLDDNISHMVINTMKPDFPGGASEAPEKRSMREIADWCKRFQELCRERGVRVTAQRLAVYRALAESTAHPTADHIYERLRASGFTLSQATVYRILECLEQEGLVRRVSTTEVAGRFDANLSRHLHLACKVCGSMVDYGRELPSRLVLPSEGIDGFVPEEFDVRIVGTCRKCQLESPIARQLAAK